MLKLKFGLRRAAVTADVVSVLVGYFKCANQGLFMRFGIFVISRVDPAAIYQRQYKLFRELASLYKIRLDVAELVGCRCWRCVCRLFLRFYLTLERKRFRVRYRRRRCSARKHIYRIVKGYSEALTQKGYRIYGVFSKASFVIVKYPFTVGLLYKCYCGEISRRSALGFGLPTLAAHSVADTLETYTKL